MYKKVDGSQKNLTAYYHERTAQVCADYLIPHIKPDSKILDVGCGPGSITRDLANLAPSGTTVGVDYFSTVVSQARASYPLPNLTFEVGNTLKLEFPDNSFDIVHCHCVLEHLPGSGPKEAMKAFYRVCRPSGVVAVCDCNTETGKYEDANDGMLDYWKHAQEATYRTGTHPHAGNELARDALEAKFARVEAKNAVLQVNIPVGGPCAPGEGEEFCLRLEMGTLEQIRGWDKAFKEWEKNGGRGLSFETVQLLAWK
ncbi:hypothetical protein HYALB_00004851 [Hymenoscyphus albidus]|uniref:Methyltransferase domain-containing protein n=1 Tax=Hymenoscyphus albidus TaxID=595503 RepID=A0A9N9LZL4_9HELO|nr:hypothetical protein HYALB_00004851 [Hymenoscyphus albidus]